MEKQNVLEANLEKHLWDAACALWGHVSPTDYMKVVTGIIFLRYASMPGGRAHMEVPPEAKWENIERASHTEALPEHIDRAMQTIEDANPYLSGVLPKNYSQMGIDKDALSAVVDAFSNAAFENAGTEQDMFGRIYEYFLHEFAEKEGKHGGEFYTPACIVRLLTAFLQPQPGSVIYDPCCGSGGMFVQSEKFAIAGGGAPVRVYGQESNPDTWKIAKMNMVLHGINADLGRCNADTFTNDLHPSLKADYILANPPFNYHPWKREQLLYDARWKYGLPPERNANFAWIQHILAKLAPNGHAGIVLSNGVLTDTTCGQGDIRKKIVEADLVECIVALPPGLFYGTGIPACLWFLSKDKKQKGKTLFIDARDMGHMESRKQRVLSNTDIQALSGVFWKFREGCQAPFNDIPKGLHYAVADIWNIAAQGYILSPGRYIHYKKNETQMTNTDPDSELRALAAELKKLFAQSRQLEEKIEKQLEEAEYLD